MSTQSAEGTAERSRRGHSRSHDETAAELAEAQERLRATSAILNLISSSSGELQPVLDGIVSTAATLCRAGWAMIFRPDQKGLYRPVASVSQDAAFVRYMEDHPISVGRGTITGRTALEGRVVHVPDVHADLEYGWREIFEITGFRTALGVPLLRAGTVIGVIFLARNSISPFSERQIALVETFADQAVIAIENVRLFNALEERNRDLNETLQQQTATSEILGMIASSPTDIEPVLSAVADNAIRLCDAYDSVIFLREGQVLRTAAHRGPIPIDFVTWPINRNWVSGRTILERAPIHVHNLSEEGEEYPDGQKMALKFGHRSLVCVPLMRQGEAIGCLMIRRLEVRPFLDKQIALLETFADQAVIAIENVRLFTELAARNHDLSDALMQQTATADVLKAISRSTFDLQTVLDSLVEAAARLCDSDHAWLFRREGGTYRWAASYGHSQPDHERVRDFFMRQSILPGRGTMVGRVVLEGRTVHIPDALTDPEYEWTEAREICGYRTTFGTPLLREGETIGVLALTRTKARPFTEKQIELATTFADQAVIAIENVRLFEEVKARTREVTEALEQQTATSEILRAISTSMTDAEPVFDTIVRSAVALCKSLFANVFRYDGELLHFVATHSVGVEYVDLLHEKYPMRPDRTQVAGRVILDRAVVRLEDALDDPEYDKRFPTMRGWRRMLGVPMLRQGEVIGVIVVGWSDPGPVPPRQEELLKTFADQAVIAVENARLFHEVETRTRELTRSVEELRALGEVSQAVNSTLDIETVLSTIVAKAVQLSGTDAGAIYVFKQSSQEFRLRATYGMDEAIIAAIRGQRIVLGKSAVGLAAEHREPMQIPDVRASADDLVLDAVVQAGFRAVLVVPLLGRNVIVGALVVRRKAPGAFADATVELLQTFATQSVLAIQNARLFREIEEKSRQLEVASRHKSQFLANMSHELRTPLNAILGYTELILDGIYGEPLDTVREVLERIQSNGRHLLGLINDVLDLSKIEAGQLTLSLADYAMSDLVQSVHTAVEGLARDKGLDFRVELAPSLPAGRADERRIAQVLLNLVGNAIKFTDSGEVRVEVGEANGVFTVAVHDTGPGIPEADRVRIFEEFQQADSSPTRTKGGSGLGLSISRRILEMHGGRLWVDSEVGHGSTFTFTLPVKVHDEAGP